MRHVIVGSTSGADMECRRSGLAVKGPEYRMVGFIFELDAFFSINWWFSGQLINLSID